MNIYKAKNSKKDTDYFPLLFSLCTSVSSPPKNFCSNAPFIGHPQRKGGGGGGDKEGDFVTFSFRSANFPLLEREIE